jgi:hypothetical protein
MSVDGSPYWGRAKDILSVLVIPALVWVFSVSNTMGEHKVQIDSLQQKLADQKDNLDRLEASERTFSVQLARLETRLDGIQGRTDEIHSILIRMSRNSPAYNP